MKYIKQFLIILAISFIGELIKFYLPFPISGSIYGMVLLFILLVTGFIKIEQIDDTAKFLLDIMPILFIPSAVGIITKLHELQEIWWQIIIITVVTTIIVMTVSGLVTQTIIRKKNRLKNQPGG
ncbi:CidA/LrgA family protein [Parablautia muri]|uniref:CidA/LrgA family protein n=1 Tax=Parablautia muri TaxID=2320879 RepID=A0A9X5BD19_9FIRM|nr:CidA/LrgA family protein [Parablautia muri]NBJ91378.1 CidA/LrgA family protein [Parablautia muri]